MRMSTKSEQLLRSGIDNELKYKDNFLCVGGSWRRGNVARHW